MNSTGGIEAGIRRRVAAVVVLYHPTDLELDNLSACISQTGRLYVVDNTGNGGCRKAVADTLAGSDADAWEYQAAGKNRGVAWALNAGAEAARRDGFDYLLTMDQDTGLRKGIVAG